MASSFSILHASVFPLQYRAPCISTRRKGKSMGNGGGNWSLKTSYKGLEMFYDDGYLDGRGLSDYFDAVTDVVQHDDAGPPRWFCPVDAGPPMKNAPLLLFLPGLEGNGMGLFMHHKALGRVFEVRCMHIPLQNRMPFEGLARFVEEVLRHEFAYSQSRPIYLLGNGFGGCLALTVAARNPNVDLSLILSNPVTCFGKLHMEPLLSFLLKLSDHLDLSMAYFLSFSTDLKVKMNYETLDKLSKNLRLPQASKLLGQTPRDTLLWKLQLLKSAALYTNSRLQVIKAAVLVLASYLDKLQPNKDEAKRLQQTLMDCKVWYFEDHGHNLLLDNDIHLMTTIKSANFFRHFKRCDRVSDYLPPSRTEFEAVTKGTRDFYRAFSPVMFSTMDDGKIVPGLSGIPNDGPVLVVGNHVLMGLDVLPLVVEFLKEKAVVLRGLGHPFIFPERSENSSTGYDFFDFVNILGAVPVSGRAFYKLLAERSFILLYPGGHHEAFHRKGEENKLFWPTQPEFVRMCGQFEATIVPFGVVGDVGELLLDRNDILRMPFIKNVAENYKRLRVANHGQHDIAPLIFPKIPGRFYYLFGKPLKVGRKMDAVQDRQNAKAIYLHVKSEVERIISYLHNKSKEDMYQSIFSRFLHEAIHGENCKVPTFEP